MRLKTDGMTAEVRSSQTTTELMIAMSAKIKEQVEPPRPGLHDLTKSYATVGKINAEEKIMFEKMDGVKMASTVLEDTGCDVRDQGGSFSRRASRCP